jgi:hypothetical protein
VHVRFPGEGRVARELLRGAEDACWNLIAA